jgi:anti-sigma factor RsiW
MMHCKKIQELLQTDYLDGQIDLPRKQFIQEHLKTCSECSALEKKLQAWRISFQGIKSQPVPERVWSNIREAIVTERLKQQEAAASGIFEYFRGLLYGRGPAMVLATSLFSVLIIFAVFGNLVIQRQIISKQNAAEKIAGYSLNNKNGYVLYDLGTSIEEYFL